MIMRIDEGAPRSSIGIGLVALGVAAMIHIALAFPTHAQTPDASSPNATLSPPLDAKPEPTASKPEIRQDAAHDQAAQSDRATTSAPTAPSSAELPPAPSDTATQATAGVTETAPAKPDPAASDVQQAPAASSAPRISYSDDEEPAAKTIAPAPSETNQQTTSKDVQRDQLPHNLSPWGMFLAADIVVKAVMISLALASVLVWTAWLGKLVQVAIARRKTRRRTQWLDTQPTIAVAQGATSGARDPVSAMVREAMLELELSEQGRLTADGIKERVASRLSRIEAAAGRAMNSGTGLLATVGGTAPFIGLFGTVWGIMNSFIGISKAQTTNLAVVAPGIAEALLATAIGLVAAIPAVIFYNQLARAISGYKAALADAAAVIERHVSRDLDRQRQARTYHLKAAE